MIDFLIILALVWILVASIWDIKKREVPNWLNFSLIAFALSYRAFFAVYSYDLWFFASGVIGLGIFIALGYGFYYARVFAGGDAKLLMALGAVLPASGMAESLGIFIVFIFLLLFSGSVYGSLWSFALAMRNVKKFSQEFSRQIKKRKLLIIVSIVFALLFLFFPIYTGDLILAALPFIVLLFPVLYIYAKSVEETCMIVSIETGKLTEGDWLYEEVRVGNRKIKPYWEGLSLEEIKLLKRTKRKVRIKQGIPFVPAFLFAFILLLAFQNYIFRLIGF